MKTSWRQRDPTTFRLLVRRDSHLATDLMVYSYRWPIVRTKAQRYDQIAHTKMKIGLHMGSPCAAHVLSTDTGGSSVDRICPLLVQTFKFMIISVLGLPMGNSSCYITFSTCLRVNNEDTIVDTDHHWKIVWNWLQSSISIVMLDWLPSDIRVSK